MFCFNGPLQNALFCLVVFETLEVTVANTGNTDYHCKELPVPKGSNTWFPTWEPYSLPLQGTAGSQRLELLVPNLGTMGHHCKQLSVPSGWNSRLPTWEPQVAIARNCRFPEVGTLGSQPRNHSLPLQGTAGSQRLELLVPNLGTRGYHCKQLPLPRGDNLCFPS